jgi:DNA repair protein SbcC/Rad50
VEKQRTLQRLGPQGTCPTCTQPLQDHYQQALAEIQIKLEQLRQGFKESRQNETKLADEIQHQEANLASLRQAKEQLLQKQAGMEEAKKQQAQWAAEVATVQAHGRQNQAQLKELGVVEYDAESHQQWRQQYELAQKWLQRHAQLSERAGRRPTLEKEQAAAEKNHLEIAADLQQTRQAQAALSFDEAAFQQAKAAIEAETRALDHLREVEGGCREEMAGLKKDAEAAAATLADQQQKAEQVKTLEQEVHYLDALEMHLSRFRLALAGRIRPLLAHRASELLALVTDNRYQLIELDTDYNISVYDANEAFSVDRYSGGEQDLINLCLRIAISQVVAERSGGFPVNMLVLDEVFASQDEERKQNILSALGRLASQFRQIFLITHVESIKESLPVILEVRFKDEETSEAVWR